MPNWRKFSHTHWCLTCRERAQVFLLVPAGLKVSGRGGERLPHMGAASAGRFPCAVVQTGVRRTAAPRAPWDCRAGGVADLPCTKSVGKKCGRSESCRRPWQERFAPRAPVKTSVVLPFVLVPEKEAGLGARLCHGFVVQPPGGHVLLGLVGALITFLPCFALLGRACSPFFTCGQFGIPLKVSSGASVFARRIIFKNIK